MTSLSLDSLAARFGGLLKGIYAAGLLALTLTLFTGRGGDIIVGDAAESFEYARVLATEGHLPRELIRFPCGVPMIGAIAYLPAYAIGRALQSIGVVSGDAWTSGWALPLQAAYCLPLLALSIAGFIANLSMLRALGFQDRIAKPAILFWIVTTNIGYYVLKEPAMTESATYATVSLYYCGLVRWFVAPRLQDSHGFRNAVLLGLVLGLSGTIRQQNILHALSLPLVLLAQARVTGANRRVGRDAASVATAALAAAAVFVIPWLVWYASTGELRLMSYAEGHFNWTQPRPWLVLFVPGYHGALLFHPVLILALVGLLGFLRQHRTLLPAFAVAVVIQLYLLSTWYWLSLGASIGHRGFMTLLPLLLPGFATVVARASATGRERSLIAGMGVLALANAVVVVLVLLQILDPTGAGMPANAGFR